MTRERYFVYLMTNKTDSVIYVGVTNDIRRRVNEHRSGVVDGFTKRYHVDKLVYYEIYNDIFLAIGREKQIKRWIRKKKNELVETKNPKWEDISV